MKLSIVVGANGFLGGNLVNKLLQNDNGVIAVYNSNYESINKKAKIVTVKEALNLSENPNYIYFLSGNYTYNHESLIGINEDLIKFCKKFPNAKIIYISSTNVYGANDEVLSETSSFKNPGLYGLSKLSGEFIVSSMNFFSIIRMTYIYGSEISNNSFLPQVIKSAKNNKIVLFGKGERKQDYIHIDDAVDLCLVCASVEKNDIYIGATGESISNLEVCEEIKKHINCNIEFTGVETGQSFYFNINKVIQELNWKPKVKFSEGIKKMLI